MLSRLIIVNEIGDARTTYMMMEMGAAASKDRMDQNEPETVSRIEQIGRASGVVSSMHVVNSPNGILHHTTEVRNYEKHYKASVPAGLHLSCGIATLQTSEADFGTASLDGSGLIAMYCEEDRPHFSTRIAAGPTRSCGLFVPLCEGFSYPQLEEIARRLTSAKMHASEAIPPDRIAALCAPIDPWFQGDARDLMMEAREIELIALFWNWMEQRADSERISAAHSRYAQKACEYIEAHLANPPCLRDLARQVGINVRSLTTAFRQTYGISIAAYVTKRRLEHAAEYMREGMSVSSAAYAVGYTPAHFSNAYMRHFGIRPREIANIRFRGP
ncbi:helix-turn-helix transcriptional regulator [Altericroceibacterium spongiae]|uniref:helix-turn-helix transcriptional regulator n=1 Tax=Altericroceibacterium spongiae TaxID=2320269 RepID=UPI001603946E|nr:AraC family transcriptional regulator [Altericroceibacterium spongiae]